ncbi:uncharacterized protein LOC111713769 [Eurytemora carolleeae]|uniref:uncharacterized protein LOC111713769 n=1 Tax=Eurytemora carolleeae TaxID=1294199 RepID=UPI000C7660AA|nr:uncharacterized protein LOC111713769 [Eurytemora carolleeae]|eukprot:XP_023344483.1 uncharacterized protein LOC111713769 [Eurytemora affinis]
MAKPNKCISTIAFVRNEADLLGCPVWVMIINIVALEMLGDKMPITECEKVSSSPTSYQIQTLKRTVNSSSDEDPYSLTGSSGYSGNCRDPGPYTPNIRATTRPDGRIKEEIYQDQLFYSTMARDSRREKQNIGDIGKYRSSPYPPLYL